jgi:uncharacterized protein YndB with AHSA1/START domain
MTAKGMEFSISRVFDAPRDLIWKAVTEIAGRTRDVGQVCIAKVFRRSGW